MKRKFLTTFFIVLLLTLFFPMPIDAATMSLSADKPKIVKDEVVTISVKIDANDEINAVQARISYPQDRLKLLSTSTANSAFDVDAPSSGGGGNIEISRGVVGNGIKGNKLIAELKFRAEKDTGSAVVTLKTDSSAVRGSDQKNILTTVRSATVSLTIETVVASASTPYKPINKDAINPTISDIKIEGLGSNSVTIEWKTDEIATSLVQYGVDTNYGLTAQGKELVKRHSVDLDSKKLEPGVTYNYRIKSVDENGNEATSPNSTFSTLSDKTPPPIPTTSPVAVATNPQIKDSSNTKYFILGGIVLLVTAIIILLLKKANSKVTDYPPPQEMKIEPKVEPQPKKKEELHKTEKVLHHQLLQHQKSEYHEAPVPPDTKAEIKHENSKYETKFKAYHAGDRK